MEMEHLHHIPSRTFMSHGHKIWETFPNPYFRGFRGVHAGRDLNSINQVQYGHPVTELLNLFNFNHGMEGMMEFRFCVSAQRHAFHLCGASLETICFRDLELEKCRTLLNLSVNLVAEDK